MKLNVVIPMAGKGNRFIKAGYDKYKPFIEIYDDITMLEIVLSRLHNYLRGSCHPKYYIVMMKEHYSTKDWVQVGMRLAAQYKMDLQPVLLEKATGGAAETVLQAEQYIDSDDRLLIHDSDQWIRWGNPLMMRQILGGHMCGAIFTTRTEDPNFSYVLADTNHTIYRVAEKEVISDRGAVGAYYWRYGSDFVSFAYEMIKKKKKTSGEYYVCPVYNEAIIRGFKIVACDIKEHYHIGTPEKLKEFLNGKALRVKV